MVEVDEQTEKRLNDLLDEKLGKVAKKTDIPTMSPDTPMPIRVTPKQMGGLCVAVGMLVLSVASGVWWLSDREHAFHAEFMTLRVEFKDSMIQLRTDMNTILAEMSDGSREDLSQVQEDLLTLRAVIPGTFPPQSWLTDVYRRDLGILEHRIERLEKAIIE